MTVTKTEHHFSNIVTQRVLTKDDKNQLEYALLLLRQNLNTNVNIEQLNVPFFTTEIVRQFLSTDSKHNAAVITDLSEYVTSLPVCTLTLAYRPSHTQLKQLIKKWRLHLHPELVLEVIYDPSIISGFISEFQGQRQDVTLLSVISKHV